jgi:glycerol kinase
MTGALLAVDQGTSSSKAVLVGSDGAILARGQARLSAAYPRPGWVEQDAEELWTSVQAAIEHCLAQAPGVRPVALAVANQRESAVVWRRADGAPAGPVIGWQDRRTADACERLRADGHGPLIQARTGLALDPMFSATKLRWLLERAPGGLAAAARGELCAGTVDAWLVFKLTGGAVFACEAGNASRTQLLDLRSAAWDPELCELFGIPPAALPEVRRSDGGFGSAVAAGSLLPGAPPISAVLADSHAALHGHGCFGPGAGKATFGTGSSVMTPVERLGATGHGVSETLAWLRDEPTYALEGNVIATGAALDWMGRIVGADGGAGLERLAAQVPDAGGVHFVPAFAGLGAPYWDREASGLVDGLTGGTTPAHLARAALEAVAHQVTDVLEAMDDAGGRLRVLFADGGASAGPLVMQLQADLSGRPVLASSVAEMSALGVAHLAGVAEGVWDGEAALAALPRPSTEYRPELPAGEREARRAAWHAAVARSRGRSATESIVREEVAP